jgi:hypothetical protein
MSLNAWEQQALDSIRDGLTSSDPTLVARLTMFTRLASGEEMPAGEKLQASMQRSRPESRNPRRARLRQAVPPLLWLAITFALIAVALAYNRGDSQGVCSGSWVTLCSDKTSASGSIPGIP